MVGQAGVRKFPEIGIAKSRHGRSYSNLETTKAALTTLIWQRSLGMAKNHLKGSVMKFTTGFAINSLFCFCVRRLSRAGLGTTVLGLCVAFAYAQNRRSHRKCHYQ